MQKSRNFNQRGGTTALVVAFLGIAVLLIAFILLNFNQLTGTHKEAQTAIDAAALQAAKDMSSIVVDGPLGRIGLIDDAQPNTTNGYPVKGINTLLATVRLDALVAKELNNNTISYLVKNDLTLANNVRTQLRQRILNSAAGQGGAFNAKGEEVKILENAKEAYNNNPNRAALKDKNSKPATISIVLGTLTGASARTNIPTPTQPGSPINDTDINGSNSVTANGVRYYLANVDIPVPGTGGQTIRLGAGAENFGLADNDKFVTLGSNDLPFVAQVTADESVNAVATPKAPGKDGKRMNQTLRTSAIAQAGGIIAPIASGALTVSFPQGFPSDPDATSGDKSPLSFNSVKTIMNASQLDNGNNPASPYKYWNAASPGNWMKASGNNFPSNGSLQAAAFKGLNNRKTDDPSVCLSFLTYDWLKTLGLRPNVKSVVDALTFDFKTNMSTSTNSKTFFANGETTLFPSAYAAASSTPGTTTALLQINDTVGDPRDLKRWDQNPAVYQRQIIRMWGYIPADDVLPADSTMVKILPNGELVSTDGNPIADVYDLQDALFMMNVHAVATYNNACKILDKAIDEEKLDNPSAKDAFAGGFNTENASTAQVEILNKILDKMPRVRYALVNSAYATQVEGAMRDNRKVITGNGVKKISSNHFLVGGADFYPPTRAGSMDEIKGEGVVSTGQDSGAALRDWCAPCKNTDKKLVSQLYFYKRTQDPVIGKANKGDKSNLFQAASAQATGTIPPNNMLKYIFHLSGSDTSPGKSMVTLHPSATSPWANVPSGNGQHEYQTTEALKVKSPDDPRTTVVWQVRARDQQANAYPDQGNANSPASPGSAAAYFNKFDAARYSADWCGNSGGCPALAAEWAITCPVPITPPPPPVPTPKPAYHAAPAPQPTPCWQTTYTVVAPFAGTIYAFLTLPCKTYNGCGALISATHS